MNAVEIEEAISALAGGPSTHGEADIPPSRCPGPFQPGNGENHIGTWAIVHTIFVEKEKTGDFQMTWGLR
jgi:hypothetical protein